MKRELQRRIDSLDQIKFVQNWMAALVETGLKRGPVMVSIGRPRRSLDQNAKLWPMLNDVAKQKQLCINGELVWAESKDWKDVFTAALRKEHRMAQGLDGGVVVLGKSTSKMPKREFSELIELIYSYGAEWGVEWSKKAKETIDEYREAA